MSPADQPTSGVRRDPGTAGAKAPERGEEKQPWLFFSALLVIPMIAVLLVTALDVTAWLERWVSALFD